MRVKDLISKLQDFDPDESIACYCEDEGLKTEEGPVQIFEISQVTKNEAEPIRLDEDNGRPWLKFGKSEKSSNFVLLEITSDV